MLHSTKEILLYSPDAEKTKKALEEAGFTENEEAILLCTGNYPLKTFSLQGKREFPSELYFEMTEILHTSYGELLYDDDEEEETEE